ncbi:hypothetical protein CRE_29571 [Caenorhabditis remanei]|uniref:HAT C-terminal dimerisation domain-containing protein n=1 Tax=Caenorhabditis remanei TaxID=31234 RepID=E3LVR2_CAERE|nr:hypothetical protein CRE_29571 [Caenorhabditis remanei]
MSKNELTSVAWSFFLKVDDEKKQLRVRASRGNPAVNYEEATENLIMAICTSGASFQLLKNSWFRKFCRILDPNFTLPTPDAARKVISKHATSYITNTMEQLSAVDVRSFARRCNSVNKFFISFDSWEDKYENFSIYVVFLYYTDDQYNKRKVLLGIRNIAGKVTSENIEELATGLLIEYNLDFSKIMGTITDERSNLQGFLNTNVYHQVLCAAEALSHIVNAASEIPLLVEVMNKVNGLVSHLSRSKSERTRFRESSSSLRIESRLPLPFRTDRPGRCISFARAFLTHYESIKSLTRGQEFILSEQEKENLEIFVQCATPYLEAINQVESDKTFCSEVLIHFASLSDFLNNQRHNHPVVKVLTEETVHQFQRFLENDIALLTTFVDPRLSYTDGVLLQKSWKDVEKLVESYCADNYRLINASNDQNPEPAAKRKRPSDTHFSKFIESLTQSTVPGSIETEIVNYKASVLTYRVALDSCPLQYWRMNQSRFPTLCRLAKDVLSAPQSSIQAERYFSECSEVVSSSTRNRHSALSLNETLLNSALGIIKRMDTDPKWNEDEESDGESDEEPDAADNFNAWDRSVDPTNYELSAVKEENF